MILEFYTDRIETVGIVKRIYFWFLIEFGIDDREWHYFGTSPIDKPPTTTDPLFEHDYIQFPNDLDALDPTMADVHLYELGKIAGIAKEGIS